MSEEILSPSEAKVKFQNILDSDFAGKLQQDEFSALKGANVSTSQTRHHNVTVGSRVANKVALQEEAINKIVETERLKREEMDKTLANKIQETGEGAGVQTWLSRELIGFNHAKNRMQELRADEQMAQKIQDEEMAAVLQEKEDKKLANQIQETTLAEDASAKLARSLSKPILDTDPLPFTRTGSGSGRQPASGQEQSQMARSRTFGAKTEPPVLKQTSRPLTGKKSNSTVQAVIPEAPHREVLRMGSVPQAGHPFLQTAADQQLFREREMGLDGQSDSAISARPDPPAYSRINQLEPSLSTQTEGTESDGSQSSLNPETDSTSVPDQSAVESNELTPVPPPPFSGVSPSKLRHNKKRT